MATFGDTSSKNPLFFVCLSVTVRAHRLVEPVCQGFLWPIHYWNFSKKADLLLGIQEHRYMCKDFVWSLVLSVFLLKGRGWETGTIVVVFNIVDSSNTSREPETGCVRYSFKLHVSTGCCQHYYYTSLLTCKCCAGNFINFQPLKLYTSPCQNLLKEY